MIKQLREGSLFFFFIFDLLSISPSEVFMPKGKMNLQKILLFVKIQWFGDFKKDIYKPHTCGQSKHLSMFLKICFFINMLVPVVGVNMDSYGRVAFIQKVTTGTLVFMLISFKLCHMQTFPLLFRLVSCFENSFQTFSGGMSLYLKFCP